MGKQFIPVAAGMLAGLVVLSGCAGTREVAEPPPERSRGSSSEDPTIGVPHPVTVNTHCGVRSVSFGGRNRVAEEPVPEPKPRPAPGGTTHYTGHATGSFTLVEHSTGRLTVDGSKHFVEGGPIVFRATDEEIPPCQ